MAGVTDTQSLRFGQVTDVITHTMQANLADDIAAQLDAADLVRTKALKRPQAEAERNATQSIPVNTVTNIQFDTENTDTHAMIDLVSNNQRITLSASAGTGLYHVRFMVSPDTTGWTKAETWINKNGAFVSLRTFWGPQSASPLEMEELVYLGTVGDFLTFSIYHEGGASTNTFDAIAAVQKICDG